MIAKKILPALILSLFITGCAAPANISKKDSQSKTPAPATQNIQAQEEKNKSKNAESKEDSLEVAVEKMKAFMASNLKDKTTPAATPAPVDSVDISLTTINVAKGTFQNLNYMTSGTALLQKKGDQYYAVFDTDFTTPNGPDLKVYLTKNSAATQRSDIKEGLDLGALKSLNGKQVYTIPSGIKIEDFHSISIHCKAFNVPWSYAALK